MNGARQLVWLYFWLLLVEGALRKWVVPGLSTPLLVVRDPVAIGIYMAAAGAGAMPSSPFIAWMGILAALSIMVSMFGDGTLLVTLYGARANFLHLPLIYVIAQVMRPSDVRKMFRALLWVSIPMAMLAIMQFRAGPNARINAGVGGTLGGQLFAASGKVRVSGTFSFVNGMAAYLGLASAAVLSAFLEAKRYPRWLAVASMVALVMMTGVSGSRTAVMTVAVVCVACVYLALLRPEQFGKALRPVMIGAGAVAVLGAVSRVFSEGMTVVSGRFTGSGGLKDGIFGRYFGELGTALDIVPDTPLFGHGLGLGTNVGARLTHGVSAFYLGEGEWMRVILESGPVIGLAYIGLRAAILVDVTRSALAAAKQGKTAPLLLVAGSAVLLLTGQFGQPTALGFAVLLAGMALAACNRDDDEEPSAPPAPVPAGGAKVRGRAPNAERLHDGGR